MITVYTIIRKNAHITVRKATVNELDPERMSNKAFAKLKNDYSNLDVYVKCDAKGNPEYRGKKEQYRLYDTSHEVVKSKSVKDPLFGVNPNPKKKMIFDIETAPLNYTVITPMPYETKTA